MVAKPSVDAPRFPGLQRPRASWLLAAGVLLIEAVLAILGAGTLWLAAAALLTPGVALAGLLPAPVRRVPLARWALAPALGIAASSVALISVARLGVPLTGVSIRVTIAVLVGIGLFVRWDGVSRTRVGAAGGAGWAGGRLAGVVEAAVLGGILIAASVLAWRVVGKLPLPGNDWAKYLLYSDEIRAHHKLLIDNPYWLGGRDVPFREDPGAPSLMGSALILSGAAAGELARTILLFSLAGVLAVYGTLRAQLGPVAGLTAAALIAGIPASQNILGWHGLANVAALALLPLVLGQLGAWLTGELDRRGEVGFALLLVGVAAAHRLTSAVMIAVVGLIIVVRVLAPGGAARSAVLWSVGRGLALFAGLGLLVGLDIRARSATAGGTLDYRSYLATKLDLELAARDLGTILIVAAGVSVIWLCARGRLPRAVWPALGLTIVSLGLAYVWVIHLPLYYARMAFYLPYGLAPLAGAGAAALAAWVVRRGPIATAGAGLVAAALFVALVVPSAKQADAVLKYYAFANPASLRGLDALAEDLRANEPVTTDRCWSFLSAWLLRHPTYPALANEDIGPRAEIPLAELGRTMMSGTADGRRLIRKLGIRYALVDPTCPASTVKVSPDGEVVFVSQRLAIIRLR